MDNTSTNIPDSHAIENKKSLMANVNNTSDSMCDNISANVNNEETTKKDDWFESIDTISIKKSNHNNIYRPYRCGVNTFGSSLRTKDDNYDINNIVRPKLFVSPWAQNTTELDESSNGPCSN
jgi:hypothetical protein